MRRAFRDERSHSHSFRDRIRLRADSADGSEEENGKS